MPKKKSMNRLLFAAAIGAVLIGMVYGVPAQVLDFTITSAPSPVGSGELGSGL